MQADIMQAIDSDTNDMTALVRCNEKDTNKEITGPTKAQRTLQIALQSSEGDGSPKSLRKLIEPTMKEILTTLEYAAPLVTSTTETDVISQQSYGPG
jgi:hypothetical protein